MSGKFGQVLQTHQKQLSISDLFKTYKPISFKQSLNTNISFKPIQLKPTAQKKTCIKFLMPRTELDTTHFHIQRTRNYFITVNTHLIKI